MRVSRCKAAGSSYTPRRSFHRRTSLFLVAVSLVFLALTAGAAERVTLVVCAPGYPGSTAEAQPAMDGLARAVASAADWSEDSLAAVYFETEAGGVEAMARPETAFALVTLPFFLEHREAMELAPRAQAVSAGRAASEPWSLVAGAGAITSSSDLEEWQLLSLAGHSPAFIRGPALGSWGELPDSLTMTFSGAVLSALRKASRAEHVAVLLDAQQTESIARLPFADKLEVVHRSEPLPVSLLCSVGERAPESRSAELVTALGGLDARPEAAEALAGVRIERFVAVHTEALARAEASFDGVAK